MLAGRLAKKSVCWWLWANGSITGSRFLSGGLSDRRGRRSSHSRGSRSGSGRRGISWREPLLTVVGNSGRRTPVLGPSIAVLGLRACSLRVTSELEWRRWRVCSLTANGRLGVRKRRKRGALPFGARLLTHVLGNILRPGTRILRLERLTTRYRSGGVCLLPRREGINVNFLVWFGVFTFHRRLYLVPMRLTGVRCRGDHNDEPGSSTVGLEEVLDHPEVGRRLLWRRAYLSLHCYLKNAAFRGARGGGVNRVGHLRPTWCSSGNSTLGLRNRLRICPVRLSVCRRREKRAKRRTSQG